MAVEHYPCNHGKREFIDPNRIGETNAKTLGLLTGNTGKLVLFLLHSGDWDNVELSNDFSSDVEIDYTDITARAIEEYNWNVRDSKYHITLRR